MAATCGGCAAVAGDCEQAVRARLDSGDAEFQVVGVGAAADRDDDLFRGDSARPAGAVDFQMAVGMAARAGVHAHLDSEGGEGFRHGAGEHRVHRRQDARFGLDDGDLHPELGEGDADLQPDIAGADDRQGRRQAVERQRARGIENVRAVERQAGKRGGARAGGEHQVGELDEARAAIVRRDHPLAGRGEAERALRDVHPGGGEQAAHAVGEAAHHAGFPRLEARHVGAGLQRRQAGARGAPGAVREVRQLDQRLAGDAAHAQAHPAHRVGPAALDEENLAPQPRRVQRGRVAAGAGPDDDEIDGFRNLADDHQRRPSSRAGSRR